VVNYKSEIGFWLKMAFFPSRLLKRPDYIGNQRGYDKLIILAHARSGSNLLSSMLKSHPNILFFGELFNSVGIYFQNQSFRTLENRSKRLRDKFPICFLNRYIFRPYSSKVKYVGFKLFPEQIDQVANASGVQLLEWLKHQKDTKVILLHRKNLLASIVSFQVAYETKNWQATKEERNQVNITLPYLRANEEFERRESYLEKMRESLRGMDFYEITYEELTEEIKDSQKDILEFLGLEYHELKSNLVKQQTRNLNEVLENYEELKSQFQGSKWKKFFE